jgi:hypothetical protein
VRAALDRAGRLHARHAPDEPLLKDRCDQPLVRDDLLDLVRLCLAALTVQLAGLALEEVVDLAQRAVQASAWLAVLMPPGIGFTSASGST